MGSHSARPSIRPTQPSVVVKTASKDGQILISRRVAAAVEDMVHLEEIGDLALKGMMQAVMIYNVATEPQQSGILSEGQGLRLNLVQK